MRRKQVPVLVDCDKQIVRAFTLVELLVVVSIIALLISILMPSLKGARDQAKAVKCAAAERQIGQAVSMYLAENNGYYPPSYVYPKSKNGAWSTDDDGQSATKQYGYMHWSYFLFSSGKIKDEAFQCPGFPKGGAPRTNPGPDGRDWEPGQEDDDGQERTEDSLQDRQATRMSYTANAAIIPRNKFTGRFSGGARVNILVQENIVRNPGNIVLATDFANNWKALGVRGDGGGTLVKSHRPINVFYSETGRWNEYNADPNQPVSDFIYGMFTDQVTFGVKKLSDVKELKSVIDGSSAPLINAVGRHHPGGDKTYGGTANFVFCDGHVERMTAVESMKERKWGDRYYSLSGPNEIMRMNVSQ